MQDRERAEFETVVLEKENRLRCGDFGETLLGCFSTTEANLPIRTLAPENPQGDPGLIGVSGGMREREREEKREEGAWVTGEER